MEDQAEIRFEAVWRDPNVLHNSSVDFNPLYSGTLPKSADPQTHTDMQVSKIFCSHPGAVIV